MDSLSLTKLCLQGEWMWMGVCGWGCVQTPCVQASKVHILRSCWALLGCSTKPMVQQLCLTLLPGMGCAARSSPVAMTPAGQHQACPMACSDELCHLSGAISGSRWAVTCLSGGALCRLHPVDGRRWREFIRAVFPAVGSSLAVTVVRKT